MLLSVTFQYVKHDSRWFSMADSVEVAYEIEDPFRVLCDGLSIDVQNGIRSRLASRDPKYVQAVIDGLNSDGGRILIQRVAFQLMLENPVGLDGSRQSYRRLIQEKCGHEPAMPFAHSHNSWIDLALALGWVGLFTFAGLMLFFLYRGIIGMKSETNRPWAMALVLVSSFWILRGFVDSVYREHYLQMQFMLLMYLFGRQQFASRKL
jgi:O-antigen ligase